MPTQVSVRGHVLPGGEGQGGCSPCGGAPRASAAPFELALRNGAEQYAACRAGDAQVSTAPLVFVPLPIAEGFAAIELLAVRSSGPLTLRLNGEAARAVTAGAFPIAALAGTTLALTLDGTPLEVVFAIGDDTPEEVARRINAAAVLAGLGTLPARVVGAQVEIRGAMAGPLGVLGPFSGDAAPLLGLSGTGAVRGTGSELAVEGVLLLQLPRGQGLRRIEVSGAASVSVLAAGT